MRVIAGSARRLRLITPAGIETRPTSDQIKETLFNMLMPYICDAVFLDLFSGSGGIGIEALSRGAKKAVFVERSKPALKCIETNLQTTHLENLAQIFQTDVMSALRQMEHKIQFDVIFMDPPYGHGLEKEVLYYLASSDLIHEDTLIVVEASTETDFDYVSEDSMLNMEVIKYKCYKSNAHVFIKRKQCWEDVQ